MKNRGHVVDERRSPGAGVVADLRTLDLDHVRAQFGQNQTGIGCRNAVADFNDHASVQWQVHPCSRFTLIHVVHPVPKQSLDLKSVTADTRAPRADRNCLMTANHAVDGELRDDMP